jgi:hypothetical protein
MVPFLATFPKLNKLPRGWTGAHNGIIRTFARKASSPKIQPTIIHTIQELKPVWMLRDRGGEGVFEGRHDSDKSQARRVRPFSISDKRAQAPPCKTTPRWMSTQAKQTTKTTPGDSLTGFDNFNVLNSWFRTWGVK